MQCGHKSLYLGSMAHAYNIRCYVKVFAYMATLYTLLAN